MAALLSQGLDGAGEALRILVDEASKIERSHHLNAQPYERSDGRRDYANGFKPKTVMTRMGEITFAVPQVRASDFYPSALEKGSRTEQALNLALAEMYVQGVSTRKSWWTASHVVFAPHPALRATFSPLCREKETRIDAFGTTQTAT